MADQSFGELMPGGIATAGLESVGIEQAGGRNQGRRIRPTRIAAHAQISSLWHTNASLGFNGSHGAEISILEDDHRIAGNPTTRWGGGIVCPIADFQNRICCHPICGSSTVRIHEADIVLSEGY